MTLPTIQNLRLPPALALAASLAFTALSSPAAAPDPTPPSPIVRQIDHIMVSSTDPKKLFALLTETFQLPVAWPFSEYGAFASGGVALGNVNLEILKAPQSSPAALKQRFSGFALEPGPLPASLAELAARRIPCGKPAPFHSSPPTASRTPLWTTVSLPYVSTDALEIFLCAYGHDVPARRQLLREQLQSRSGGPLGIRSVQELTLGAKDPQRRRLRWQKLLAPAKPTSPGLWPIGSGPALHVTPADADEIRGLVINVTSLSQAQEFLLARRLPFTPQNGALLLAIDTLQDLPITLVQLPSEFPPATRANDPPTRQKQSTTP